MATEVSTILTVDIRIIDGAADLAADLAADSAVDLAAKALAKAAAAFMADIEMEIMAIAHMVEAIPAELILGITNIAAAIIYDNSLRSATSITRKAAGLQSTCWRNGNVLEIALLYT